MLAYNKNNIFFRISSSDVIARFKAIQAHSFLEMCRKDIDIDESAREVLLLSYDLFFSTVILLEKTFLLHTDEECTPSLVVHTLQLIDDMMRHAEEICYVNSTVFTRESHGLLQMVHSYSRSIFVGQINTFSGLPLSTAFVDLVMLISEYLQQLLVVIHEYDNNIIKNANEKFISITRFCTLKSIENHESPLVIRARWLSEHNKICTRFTLKNYSDNSKIFSLARTHLEHNGFSVDSEVMCCDE